MCTGACRINSYILCCCCITIIIPLCILLPLARHGDYSSSSRDTLYAFMCKSLSYEYVDGCHLSAITHFFAGVFIVAGLLFFFWRSYPAIFGRYPVADGIKFVGCVSGGTLRDVMLFSVLAVQVAFAASHPLGRRRAPSRSPAWPGYCSERALPCASLSLLSPLP